MTDPLTSPLEAWLETLPPEYGPEERILLAIGFTAGWSSVERNLDAVDDEPCPAETWSWDHFTPNQVDPYWIRCTLRGDHDEHEDENTGLTWKPESA